jgi:copper homeostasis protein
MLPTFTTRPLCEVCVDSVAGAIAAEQGGADRIELCANLVEGGTTPSAGMIRAVCDAISLPVMVMIRPRGGHFCYDASEITTMRYEAAAVLATDVAGIVIGALHGDGSIDHATCVQLCQAAQGRSVTFHRAFDQVADPFAALETLVTLGINRVLTSGQADSAWQGMSRLRQLVQLAASRISIMAGGGIRAHRVQTILRETGVREIHFSGSQLVECPVSFWRVAVPMSVETTPGDLRRRATSLAEVREICQAARTATGA